MTDASRFGMYSRLRLKCPLCNKCEKYRNTGERQGGRRGAVQFLAAWAKKACAYGAEHHDKSAHVALKKFTDEEIAAARGLLPVEWR